MFGDVLMIVFGVILCLLIDSVMMSGLIVEFGLNVLIIVWLCSCWLVRWVWLFGLKVG